MIDNFAAAPPRAKEIEVWALQHGHPASCLMGYCDGAFERIDEVHRRATAISVREETEAVNGVHCYVIDAKTKYGDFTLWIDPEHGFNIAKRQIRLRKEAGHLWRGQIMQFKAYSQQVEIGRFDLVDGVWIGTEVVQHTEYLMEYGPRTETWHINVTRFALNPDHEKLGSFKTDDIPDGTLVIIVPVTHIRYVWHGGDLIKHIDENIVAELDRTLETMKMPKGALSSAEAIRVSTDAGLSASTSEPNRRPIAARPKVPSSGPRPHCGLYCIYSVLKLVGQDIDFRDLVKAEYYGRLMGSSLAELNRAAKDYGLHAGVVTRLSTRALRDCPYQAILHVRRDAEAKEYDHYQLFLGTENGKAKLLDPPRDVKLVKFSELAPLWDGYALFVSPRPFEVDAIFTADRQRLLLYAMLGCLVLLAAHLGQRVWLAVVGNLPRRWSLGLTAGQATLLVLAALLCGGFYHFANDEGLLANAVATQSFQKAYMGGFIPRISEKKTRRLLGTGVVFIDARLAPDYERGHLEGAISVPVDANDAIRQQRTADIPRDARIVLYCQSAGCKFAERVGVELVEAGFMNLSIFKGGWMEWTAKHPQASKVKGENERIDGEQRDQS